MFWLESVGLKNVDSESWRCRTHQLPHVHKPTTAGLLADNTAGFAGLGVPTCVDLDFDTVRGPWFQVTQNHPALWRFSNELDL